MDKMFQLLRIGFESLIFTAIGVVAFSLSFYFRRRTKRFIGESLQTQGEVIGLHEVHDEGSVLYAPVIRYIASDGVAREFTDSVSSSPASYTVGDRVKVLSHRQNPKDARVAATVRLYLAAIILGLIGVVFCSLGVAVAIGRLLSQG
jgi:predicted metalloprotease with PDZ domain